MKKIYPIIGLIGLAIFSMPSKIFAVTETKTEFGSVSDLGQYLSIIFDWALPIAAALAVAIIIYSGIIYVTSGGNQETINKAKEYLIGALTGLALLFLIRLLISTLGLTV